MSSQIFYSYTEVKKKCQEGRFFSYSDWFDRIFIPPSFFFVWLFINLRVSANFVSWISVIFAVCAAFLFASSKASLILIGSILYLLYYLFDYVDGAVARFNMTSGISGQYIDWIMHVISSTAIMSGIAFGALKSSGFWLTPFCILGIIASILTYARHSMAWFSVIMHAQQSMTKKLKLDSIKLNQSKYKSNLFLYELIRKIVSKIYHEETLIFLLPVLAAFNFYGFFLSIDFRVILIIGAGALYLPIMFIEVQRLASSNKIEVHFNKLFINNEKPNLPDDHFFK